MPPAAGTAGGGPARSGEGPRARDGVKTERRRDGETERRRCCSLRLSGSVPPSLLSPSLCLSAPPLLIICTLPSPYRRPAMSLDLSRRQFGQQTLGALLTYSLLETLFRGDAFGDEVKLAGRPVAQGLERPVAGHQGKAAQAGRLADEGGRAIVEGRSGRDAQVHRLRQADRQSPAPRPGRTEPPGQPAEGGGAADQPGLRPPDLRPGQGPLGRAARAQQHGHGVSHPPGQLPRPALRPPGG